MTKVTFYTDDEGHFVGLRMQGHSDHSNHGSDIVCAGLSVLCQTTIIGVKEVARANCYDYSSHETTTQSILVSEHIISIAKKASLFITTAYYMAQLLQEQYPDNINVRVVHSSEFKMGEKS